MFVTMVSKDTLTDLELVVTIIRPYYDGVKLR